ncbi:Glycosyl transferase, group 1 family protein (plasmid) [Sinorhizobium sojae CCBAU 05684]|uniref:Glycosyl transferase, group 1 family protein n=1 Tax=Sinorhizobium sojae CCBAU 05684 TaxID=716928 RepID=A0A249PJR5_9HYPH|nr:glycosyltransferase family 4 protein [Sinorhizobium sojae]ASY65982.1 Glycosyl transferase, group 1 family protein [Sinorhizobium sojae CCBAU 05684]
MRLLVYPHELSIGGSQINAIDLASAVANAGHDVVVYGVPGPLISYIEERGLRYIPARRLRYRPAPSRIVQLAALASRERIDLIHAYEWPTCLDAYYGAGLFLNVPLLCTVLSMQVMPHVPASVPLIMGTRELGAQARKVHRGRVWVLEPPIDVERDTPFVDGKAFRSRHRVANDEFLVVSVSRLAVDLKLDALVRAIDAADLLAGSYSLKLVLLGDGPAREALTTRASAVNRRHGREVVILPGADLDPRSAYAAADLVLGMGSSALRALSIGRPLIVQGEEAFSEVFEPSTCELFLRQGFYGLAEGAVGARRLAAQVESLIRDPGRRAALAHFGREMVAKRFSLQRAADLQLDIYRQILADPPKRRLSDAMRSARLSLMLEIANHDPFRKREKKLREKSILATVHSGSWPPVLGE